jgi:hypothetical protein
MDRHAAHHLASCAAKNQATYMLHPFFLFQEFFAQSSFFSFLADLQTFFFFTCMFKFFVTLFSGMPFAALGS